MAGVAELVDQAVGTPPGPQLSALLNRLPWRTIPNSRLVEVVQARSRQRAHEEAEWLAGVVEVAHTVALAELGADRAESVARAGEAFEWASHEIAAALTWTPTAADRELGFAVGLVERLPLVYAALHRGEIDRGKARVFVEYLDPAHGEVGEEQSRRLCERFLPAAPGLTTRQLGDRIYRALHAIDPHYRRRRYRRAVQERGIALYLDPATGTATLVGTGLPADEAAAAAARLDRLAEAARRAGHPGTRRRISADLFLGMLNGAFHGLTENEIIQRLLSTSRPEDLPDDDTPAADTDDTPAAGEADTTAAAGNGTTTAPTTTAADGAAAADAADSDADADVADAGADSGAGADADSDSGADADSDSGADADSDSGADADSGAGAGVADADADSGAGADVADSDSGAGADDADADADPASTDAAEAAPAEAVALAGAGAADSSAGTSAGTGADKTAGTTATEASATENPGTGAAGGVAAAGSAAAAAGTTAPAPAGTAAAVGAAAPPVPARPPRPRPVAGRGRTGAPGIGSAPARVSRSASGWRPSPGSTTGPARSPGSGRSARTSPVTPSPPSAAGRPGGSSSWTTPATCCWPECCAADPAPAPTPAPPPVAACGGRARIGCGAGRSRST
ncbi:DUF222 domain-containing protein [Pseudonocardia sichuanensis]